MGRPSTAKQRLLDTACREFARIGAQAIGVDELCRKAGINKGSFYHFFPSKSDLILKCLEVAWDELRNEVFEPAFAPDRPPLNRIEEFFDRVVAMQEKNRAELGVYTGCLFCTLGNEMAFLDSAIQKSAVNFMNINVAYLTAAFSDAHEIKPQSSPPELLAEITYSLLLGSMIEVKIRQELTPLFRAKAASLGLIRGTT